MWVVLDVDTPSLNKLSIIGVLEIPDTLNSSSTRQARAAPQYRTVVIDAVYISIQVNMISNITGFLLTEQ